MNSFISYPEMPLTLFKGNANRVENEMNSFISYPEMPLTLFKGNANQVENEMNSFISYPPKIRNYHPIHD